MSRREWGDLPAGVREAIEAECGPVAAAVSPPAGRNSDLSATVHTRAGEVLFCKGVETAADSRKTQMHRHEAWVNSSLPELAPRLLWRVETDGWLVHGFERVAGQHADLSPGSPDLQLVAAAVTELRRTLTPSPVEAPRLADQWGRLAAWRRLWHQPPDDLDPSVREHIESFVDWEYRAFELVDGDALCHTDLHALNILVSGRARVIDWAWSRRCAGWVDPAFLVLRLIEMGHPPAEAELWAEAVPAWRSTSEEARTAFSVAVWGIWEYLQRAAPAPHRAELSAVAQTWATYRIQGGAVPRSSR
jgi:Ser/Thr protein kinase RdoA (MazF antagonist)